MTPPDPTPPAQPGLPGLRATVRESQAKARASRERARAEAEPAPVDPVARVLVDVPLAHLDRTFDYAVPAALAEAAVPGVRVKVRFAGQEVGGYLLERAATTDHAGRLAPLRRVVSPEPVLSPAVAALAADVAARYAGVRSDVLRLAVPPRHATAEKAASVPAPPVPTDLARPHHDWSAHPAAPALLRHLHDGGAPRAVVGVLPGEPWPALLADLVAATLAGGRGTIVCLPDGKDVARLDAALTQRLGPDQHVVLAADAGPARRYRDFLAVSRGARRVVIGTRSAAFAPVHDLGLVVVWDDGDDLHAEPRAPYPHTREVLLLRAEREGTAAVLAGFARSVEADHLLVTGWAHEVGAPREVVRARFRVDIAGASDPARGRDPSGVGARVPREAHLLLREGLERGPVLVQTPRGGYAAALACERCRTPARCAACAGPLALRGPLQPPTCRWCGTPDPAWACAECGHHGLRAPVVGDARTAEELGRAFPKVRVLSSAGDHVLATVPDRPALVVATPGAEPVAAAGYAAVLLLDTWAPLAREDLRAAEEALRRWSNAVGLLAPGGRALAVGDPAHPALQALVRWDHGGFAAREAAERRSAHLPPATRVATLTGEPGALDDALTLLPLPPVAEVLGPVPVPSAGPRGPGGAPEEAEEQVVVRTPRVHGAALAAALGELQRVRSARKLDAVRVRLDPPSL